MIHSRKVTFRITIYIIITFLLIAAIGSIGYAIWLHQIHTVLPHYFYRSAQLSPQSLQQHIKAQKIATVINLRGANPDKRWYQQELATTKNLGVKHYDVMLSSRKLPPRRNLRKLAYLLMNAPTPVLVHCLSGADRSGLAAAMALILRSDSSLAVSLQQISLSHLVLHHNSIGKLVFGRYQQWLLQQKLPHSRANFLKWICSDNLTGRRLKTPIGSDKQLTPCPLP